MKLALFDQNRLGIVLGEELADVTEVLPAWDPGFGANFWVRMCRDFHFLGEVLGRSAEGAPRLPLSQVRLRAPVLNPSKVVAAASNYGRHREEMGPQVAESWLLDFGAFLKAPSAVIGPGDTLELPGPDLEVHHEAELAFVIGKRARRVGVREAWQHILGYTGLIDVVVRGKGDRSMRKSYDGFCPMGPWLTTADEIPDPHQLRIQLWVNGELRQDAATDEMLVKIPELLSFISQHITLYPGDVVATGTPAGVGPLRPGDAVRLQIERIGSFEVRCSL